MTSKRRTKGLVTRTQRDKTAEITPKQAEVLSSGLLKKMNADLQEQFESDVATILELMSSRIEGTRPSSAEATSQFCMAILIAERKARAAEKLRDEIREAFHQPRRRAFLSG